ncbi:COMM domain containing 9 [Homo sapiens]|uniref:COMM domain containing 9 n=1 Tax=Homo sapiens TaxID=9606 RepID=E9PJ95_HUMAN|nr:COMM domain-containing protein 9 isoform 3 [Homo sapiens]KAI2559452.1 COMM domain containing 9 [Homo sapiens]KAI4070796.1 COMM domain containing 9 [Homo sapiens]|eukprot:NP_001294861.1 COMM domain-containing protein 9 isoform 3 [Homo sapiens]
MAALTAEHFAALQSLLKASSKDVVRQLCQESFSSSALGLKKLLDVTCSSLSVTQEEAEELLQALHRLTRLVAFRDLSSAEAILALFPENFHQNLKNLLTKIILEHVLSATPGRSGLESGYQNLLRQHQPHGRPHLPAPDEDPRRSQPMRRQTLHLSCHRGAEQRNTGHHVRWPGPHPRPTLCRGQ